jgi:hypothetical protein
VFRPGSCGDGEQVLPAVRLPEHAELPAELRQQRDEVLLVLVPEIAV